MNERLIIAVQKDGRLSQGSVTLLAEAGISFTNGSRNRLRAPATTFPLDVLYLRDDDIPECVADGVADVGIVGENVLLEHAGSAELITRLGFARCRLAIAVPRQEPYGAVADLAGRVIATTYPQILRSFLEREGVSATIRRISGSTEVAPSIGIADAICDLVSTGSTLISNGLREVETVMRSEAVLVRGPSAAAKGKLLDRFEFRLDAVLRARNSKYILLNCRNEDIGRIAALLPGIKSPTVMPLATEGWSSLHTVARENELWEVIEQIRDAGAEGVLVLPIQRMVSEGA